VQHQDSGGNPFSLDFRNTRGSLIHNLDPQQLKEIRTMKKLMILALAVSIISVGAVALAQDSMGQSDTTKAAAAPLKNLKGTIKADGDKYTFVTDKDQKSWDIMNPDAVKGHEGHHVELSAHVYADKGSIHVMSVKMMK
jgi:hypothetical protein